MLGALLRKHDLEGPQVENTKYWRQTDPNGSWGDELDRINNKGWNWNIFVKKKNKTKQNKHIFARYSRWAGVY